MLGVQVRPLNTSSGMKILGDGSFQQIFDRDSNSYYPYYSGIKPLKVTLGISVQDPDEVIPTGDIAIDRIDWYLGEYKPSSKISDGNADYTMAVENGVHVLLIKKNTPVGLPFYLIGEAFFTNIKTSKQESRIAQQLLSTMHYQALNLALVAQTPTEIIVDPTRVDDTVASNWYVSVGTALKSGNTILGTDNRRMFWYVKEGDKEYRLTTSYPWLVSKPSDSGYFGTTIEVDSSRFKNIKLVCRAAYRGLGEEYPTSPSDPSLYKEFNIRVDMPKLDDVKAIPIAGLYITPKDMLTTEPDKQIKYKCQIIAGGTVILNPEKYYNITWMARHQKGGENIAGYGEYVQKGARALGVSYTNMVELYPVVKERIGNWNIEGSIYSGLPATPVLKYGASQIADKLGAYLVKCDDGVTPQIVGKLMNNNWNRFEDGSLAPTMVNSAAEDKGYNVMYGWKETVHTIENAMVGDEIVSLFSEQPFEYNGLKSRVIPPTLICPGLPTVYDGKFRSIYFKWNAVPGSDGHLGITFFNQTDRSYPKGGLSQFTTNTFALAHNSDKTKPYPYAPLMDWHLLNITNALMNKFGTVALHSSDMFGGGVSGNITPTSATVEQTTSAAYKLSSDPATSYPYREILSQTPSFYVDAVGTKKTWSDILSKESARVATLETQMALSHAAENNIQPNVSFRFNGNNYRYFDIPGFKTILEGEMNAKLTKTIGKNKIEAYDANGDIVEYDIVSRIQSSCVYGIDLVSADLMQYAGAGMERVVTITDAYTGNNPNNIIRNYLCIDQTKLSLDTTVKKSVGEDFDFENSPHYTMVGENQQVNAYYTDLFRGTRIGATKKGSLYENVAYNYNINETHGAAGEKIRLGVKVRGYGFSNYTSARSVISSIPLSSSSTRYAGGFQVRLPE